MKILSNFCTNNFISKRISCHRPFHSNNAVRPSKLFSFWQQNAGKSLRVKSHHTLVPARNGNNRQPSFRLLKVLGCGTICVTFGLWKHKNCFVRCEANRLSDFSSHLNHDHDVRFNWTKFWQYLKPHLFKLIAAICVSNTYDHNCINFIKETKCFSLVKRLH